MRDYDNNITETKLDIFELTKKNHNLEIELRDQIQVYKNKEKYIVELLEQTMNKDVELGKIHAHYNTSIVNKDTTMLDFSEKHNKDIFEIKDKFNDHVKYMSNKHEGSISELN